MDCDGFARLLDAYIDGALTEAEARQFMAHADACEGCREELRRAEWLRDMMKDMDDEIAVPLEAQAAWRKAVRAESQRGRLRRITRIVSAAAAALALAVGVSFVLNDGGDSNAPLESLQPIARSAATQHEENELIASDGIAESFDAFAAEGALSAVWKIEAENRDEACQTLSLLCEEYSGKFSMDAQEQSLRCRIELPYEYMSDFLSAASRIGTKLHSEIYDSAQETAVILIELVEQ